MRARLFLTLCLALFCGLSAFAFQADVPPDRGYIKGGEYHSVFFGFRYKIPEGWTASTVEEKDDGASARFIAKDEASAQAMQDAGKSNMHLLVLTRGAESIRLAAQDIYFTDVKSPEAYLDNVEEAMGKMAAMRLERMGEKSHEVEGRRLVSRTYKAMISSAVVYQSMTAMLDRKYLLLVVATFLKPEALEASDPVKAMMFEPRTAPAAVASRPVKEGPQHGNIEGGKYINPYFGLSLNVGSDWEIQDPEAMRRLQAASQRTVKAADAEAHQEALQRTHFLLTAAPKARGALLMAFAEDLQMMELESAEQYIRIMATGMNSTPKVGPETVTVGGKKFSRAHIEQQAAGQVITHLVYVTLERNFALVFDVLSADPGQLAQGQKIVEAMTFRVPEKPAP